MVVTKTWIPIEHIYDSQLVDALTRNRRRFIKGLRYNLPASRPLAATVLSDASPSPSALYIIPPGAGPDYRSALGELVTKSPSPLGSGMPAKTRCRFFRSRSGLSLLVGKGAAMGTKERSMVSSSARCENREACFCANIFPAQSLHSRFV